jgi:uncharacterized protein (UPF0261 family)
LEYAYLSDRIRERGADVVLVDAGIVGAPLAAPDVTREEVAAAAGADVEALAAAGDRGAAVETMARGAAEIVKRLRAEGRLDAIGGLGGSGGSSIATYAMRQLPIGVPKLMVSTVASGDTSPYVGSVDVTMMYSVVDIAGINRISAQILTNAAAALVGMASATVPPLGDEKPLITASMFGVTTAAVTTARERLEGLGYEVLVFHQTGAGGGSMEALIDAGFITGSLDVTTTEFCDLVAGGVLVAVPERLESAGKRGIPQVVSLGALDMVNFGPLETVPERYRDRNLYVHNPTITLMRTTADECREIGRIISDKLNTATGPTVLFVPLRGVSAIATEGQVFYDPEADAALFETIRSLIDPAKVELHEVDTDVNDPAFALAMADRLHELIEAAS